MYIVVVYNSVLWHIQKLTIICDSFDVSEKTSCLHGRQSEPDHGGGGGGGAHSFFFFRSDASRASPKKADERWGGGGGTLDIFLFDLNIFGSIFQTQSRGTHRTSPTSLTSKKKKKLYSSRRRAHTWKIGPHLNELIIQPQNRGGGRGGTFDIMSPPLENLWGDVSPPPPPHWCPCLLGRLAWDINTVTSNFSIVYLQYVIELNYRYLNHPDETLPYQVVVILACLSVLYVFKIFQSLTLYCRVITIIILYKPLFCVQLFSRFWTRCGNSRVSRFFWCCHYYK